MICANAMMDENGTEVLPARREKQRRSRRAKAGAVERRIQSRVVSPVAASRAPFAAFGSHRAAGDGEAVLIELSKSQVDQVVRSAGQGGTLSVLLSAVKDPQWPLSLDSEEWSYPAQMEDRRLSRSLLSGLLVLSCFPVRRGIPGDRRTRAHARHEHEHDAPLRHDAARGRAARAQPRHSQVPADRPVGRDAPR